MIFRNCQPNKRPTTLSREHKRIFYKDNTKQEVRIVFQSAATFYKTAPEEDRAETLLMLTRGRFGEKKLNTKQIMPQRCPV